MEDGEVFDSSLLKETMNSTVSTGKRNFAIDLTSIDYIYSDTINVLMTLNRKILDVSGRLSLLGPQPEVMAILQRAGVHNILRIYNSEEDLIKTSEDIIKQASSFKLGDVKTISDNLTPESEFDQLRSEIGSAFGSSDELQEDMVPKVPPPRQQYQPPPRQEYAAPPQDSTLDEEFDEAFSQFESQEGTVSNDYGQDSVEPPPRRAGFIPPPLPQQFQARQYSPPPPPMPPAPPKSQVSQPQYFEPQKPQSNFYKPPEPQKPEPDFSSMRPETQRFPTAPVPPSKPVQSRKPEPVASEFDNELEEFEFSSRKKPSSRKPPSIDSFESEDDELENEFKKKSPLPMLMLVVLILAIGGAGVFFGYTKFLKKPQTPLPAPTVQQPVTPPAPQISTETKTEEPVVEEKVIEEEMPEPSPVKETVARRRTPKPAPRSRPAPVAKARKATPATTNQITVTSSPSGAAVKINGQVMGQTPYTWKNPFFGGVNIAVSKSGYKESTKSLEFTGGSLRESFSLEKEPSPPPVAKPEPKAPPSPPAPVVKAEPPAPPPEPEPELDFDDPEPEPAVSAPSTPVASSAGGSASIFIASLPPVADVYLEGKLIGKTNVNEISLPAGTHSLKFVKGAKEATKVVTVQPGKNPSFVIRLP